MGAISDYVKIVTTLLGIAYPILFQVVARLDEKYSSNLIVELFDEEKVKIYFKVFLISSLLSFLLWSLEIPSFINIEGFNFLINNSAAILVILNTCLLVISFFLFVNKILIYYTPSKFINYLIRNHNRSDINLTHFKALSDVFIHSIKKQNITNSTRISRFFYDSFKTERVNSKDKPVVYPDSYYTLVYNSIEELAIFKTQRNPSLEYRTSGGVWLLGEMEGAEISDTTYACLWRNILLAVKYENDDLIIYHWEHCHQYFWTSFKNIRAEYDEEFNISNTEQLEKVKSQKERFLEFHYALGGLLLYKKRYTCLGKIFTYTTSEPPKYELLPETMQEIFSRYDHFRDPLEFKFPWMSSKYPFRGLIGVNSSRVIKKWICHYMALLFLRQYTIVPYLIYMKPLEFPSLPKTQGEKKRWIEGLDFFKRLLNESLSNSDLIKSTDLDFITEEWCSKYGKLYPITYLEQLKDKFEDEYSDGEVNTPLAAEKIQEFYDTTAKILENVIDSYSELNRDDELVKDYNKWFVNGQKMIQNRDPFTQTPEAHHLNYDSILGSLLAENIKVGIDSTFQMSFTKSYLLKPQNIFKAIDKLNIIEDYLILNPGINIEYYISFHRIEFLTVDNYRGIKIINLPQSMANRNSIFLIRKIDLPSIISVDIESKIDVKYSPERISKKYNIFASVIDLNNASEEIRNENSQEITTDELRKYVLLNIFHSTEIRWKKNIDLIELIEYSEYRQMGLENELEDVVLR